MSSGSGSSFESLQTVDSTIELARIADAMHQALLLTPQLGDQTEPGDMDPDPQPQTDRRGLGGTVGAGQGGVRGERGRAWVWAWA